VSDGKVSWRRDSILSPDPIVVGGAEGRPLVGVLALQGDFREHRLVLERLGAATREVRQLADLQGLDGLVIPGGESTTIGKLMVEYDLLEGIRSFSRAGKPVFGTCAGLITLSNETVEKHDQPLLGLIDIVARRNAFGRQVHSFEGDLRAPAFGERPLHAVFIRGPWIESAGEGVSVLAEVDGHGVAASQGNVLVTAFHPELTDDTRVHEYFLQMVRRGAKGQTPAPLADLQSREGVVS
jgi:5'-phosphate synthase pdxT subunit